ncbi:hypothetical protein MOQ_004375 [Trypanosoma cruzi marinkellei]|uniref:Uncharacterized protein n=1 Tax=Trypanosoma cruzi marinkellei TaxID=85056 RepID=K2NA77_TRYCR|nr:hypothetical protein MOQ_004375 [Trypanosoma cruzi marinkellei]
MSLVTNPRNIIIEKSDLFDDSSDAGSRSEEERILEALREIRGAGPEWENNNMELRAREMSQRFGEVAQDKLQKEEGGKDQLRRKKPPRCTPEAVERVNLSTVASRARSQRKYVDQLKEIQRQKSSPAPRAISPTATKAGLRLYAAAVGCQRRLEKMREEREKLKRENEEKIKFQPRISTLAKRLWSSGYVPLHERFNRTKEKLAQNVLLRERERMDRVMAGCTFHPTLAENSAKMAVLQRKNEPFSDVGERLFFEGGRRLIRQQLRQRILEQKAENGLIGDFQISNEAAEELALRLWKWQEASNRNREHMQREYVQRVTQPASPRLRVTQQPQQGRRSSCSGNRTHQPLFAPSFSSENNVVGRIPEDEIRQIRCRALFRKYASSENSVSLQLQEVKRQVRELFPEDSGIVAALASNFSGKEEISMPAFVECLVRFEQLHGPQRWGNPRWDHVTSVAEEPPVLFSQPPSLASCQEEALDMPLRKLRRSKSTCAPPLEGKKGTLKKDATPRCCSAYRRSSSASACGRSSGGACDSLRGHERGHQRGERSVTRLTTVQKVGERTAESGAAVKGSRSLGRREAIPHQKPEKSPARDRIVPREVPNASPSHERSSSLESVEVSSITEEAGSTPDMKQPGEIVAELEALIAKPFEIFSAASPMQTGTQRVCAPRGSVVSSLPSPLRRNLHKVPVPCTTRDECYSTVSGGRAAHQKLLKEVEEVLGVGTVSLAID